MKKHLVLLIISFLFLSGCSAFLPSPAIRVDNAIKKVGQKYAITRFVSVAVIGYRAREIKDVFRAFGFPIVADDHKEKADYIVQTEVENLGIGYSFGFQIYPAKVWLKVVQESTGIEDTFEGTGEFRLFQSYYSYGINRTYHYAQDPYGLAAKIAAAEAVGNFIEKNGIDHRWPEELKKKKKEEIEEKVQEIIESIELEGRPLLVRPFFVI